MNFLAHLFLADMNAEAQVGQFLGDFVKGPLKGERPKPIELEIQLHRNIDAWTDSHSLLRECRLALTLPHQRYLGIAFDLAFDHLLTRHWQQWSPLTLPEFSRQVHINLKRYHSIFPKNALIFFQRMEKHNLLCQYDRLDQLKLSLEKIALRSRFKWPVNELTDSFPNIIDRLTPHFDTFFSTLQQFTREKRQTFFLSDI